VQGSGCSGRASRNDLDNRICMCILSYGIWKYSTYRFFIWVEGRSIFRKEVSSKVANMSFEATFLQFMDELTVTFPEFSSELDTSRNLSKVAKREVFLNIWKTKTSDVASQNADLFANGQEIVPNVVITKQLWNELSANTQTAIWKYISSLLLLAISESKETVDLSGFQHDIEELLKKLKEGGFGKEGGFEGIPGLGNMKEMFEKFSSMASEFGFKDFTDLSGMKDKFKIPERMFKGQIAKIVQELVKEFNPEDFGITVDMVDQSDPTKVFEILQDIFTKNPDLVASAAQKIAKKIQAKFQNGEIRREEIIAEAEELMKEFSENDMFSSLFGSIGEMMKGSEKSSGNEGSARRREVQERLRKKKAEKDAAKSKSNIVVHAQGQGQSPQEIEADRVAAALMLEESKKPVVPKNKKK